MYFAIVVDNSLSALRKGPSGLRVRLRSFFELVQKDSQSSQALDVAKTTIECFVSQRIAPTIGSKPDRFLLLTTEADGSRQKSGFGDPLENFFQALKDIAFVSEGSITDALREAFALLALQRSTAYLQQQDGSNPSLASEPADNYGLGFVCGASEPTAVLLFTDGERELGSRRSGTAQENKASAPSLAELTGESDEEELSSLLSVGTLSSTCLSNADAVQGFLSLSQELYRADQFLFTAFLSPNAALLREPMKGDQRNAPVRETSASSSFLRLEPSLIPALERCSFLLGGCALALDDREVPRSLASRLYQAVSSRHNSVCVSFEGIERAVSSLTTARSGDRASGSFGGSQDATVSLPLLPGLSLDYRNRLTSLIKDGRALPQPSLSPAVLTLVSRGGKDRAKDGHQTEKVSEKEPGTAVLKGPGQESEPVGSFWPFPESFMPCFEGKLRAQQRRMNARSGVNPPEIVPRCGHPRFVLLPSRQGVFSAVLAMEDRVPIDRYVVHSPSLAAYLKSIRGSHCCFVTTIVDVSLQVRTPPAAGDRPRALSIAPPFGVVSWRKDEARVEFLALSTNFEGLLELVSKLPPAKHRNPVTLKPWKPILDSFAMSLPGYYAPKVKKTLHSLGVPLSVYNEALDVGALNASLRRYLSSTSAAAFTAYQSCLSVTSTQHVMQKAHQQGSKERAASSRPGGDKKGAQQRNGHVGRIRGNCSGQIGSASSFRSDAEMRTLLAESFALARNGWSRLLTTGTTKAAVSTELSTSLSLNNGPVRESTTGAAFEGLLRPLRSTARHIDGSSAVPRSLFPKATTNGVARSVVAAERSKLGNCGNGSAAVSSAAIAPPRKAALTVRLLSPSPRRGSGLGDQSLAVPMSQMGLPLLHTPKLRDIWEGEKRPPYGRAHKKRTLEMASVDEVELEEESVGQKRHTRLRGRLGSRPKNIEATVAKQTEEGKRHENSDKLRKPSAAEQEGAACDELIVVGGVEVPKSAVFNVPLPQDQLERYFEVHRRARSYQRRRRPRKWQ